jgi:pimeloyl-ACP methyl ester carboxylesterase
MVIAEYPFKTHKINIGGHQMSYVDEGDATKEVIVMLHGNPTWSYYYRHAIANLSKDFRVIVPDHIGCGFSDKPQDYEYTLANHVLNVRELLQRLAIKDFSLVVHDWGGAIGMGVATELPKQVKKVVFLNTGAFNAAKEIPWRIGILKTPVIGEIFTRSLNGFAFPATFMASEKPLSKEVKAAYLIPYNNYTNRIATIRFVQDIPLTQDHPTFKTLDKIEKKLPELTCPKLFLWGEKDFCFNMNFLNRFKEIYPEAKVVTYPKAGHYVLEDEREEVINQMTQFFKA